MPWVLIPIIAIIAWAIVESQRHRSAGGALADEEKNALSAALARLDATEAERQRLRERVENLEAIVTSEAYELERQARLAIPEAEQRPLLELDDPGVSDEEQVARRAERLRQG